MTLFVVAAAGRQVAGDAFLHLVEAAFKTASEAEAFVAEKGRMKVQTLPTGQGDIECVIQRTVYPVEVAE